MGGFHLLDVPLVTREMEMPRIGPAKPMSIGPLEMPQQPGQVAIQALHTRDAGTHRPECLNTAPGMH
jgi:hypothetical protein